jgi:hypothetical protein
LRDPGERTQDDDRALETHEEVMRWLLLCPVVQSLAVFELWDDAAFHVLATRAEHLARTAGALTILPVALMYLSGVRLFAGDFAGAAALVQEADSIATATGNVGLLYSPVLIGAWRGSEREALRLIEAGRDSAIARGEGRVLALRGSPLPCSTTASAAGRRLSTPPSAAAKTPTRGTPHGRWSSLSRRLPGAAGPKSPPPRCAGWSHARALRAPTGRSASWPVPAR